MRSEPCAAARWIWRPNGILLLQMGQFTVQGSFAVRTSSIAWFQPDQIGRSICLQKVDGFLKVRACHRGDWESSCHVPHPLAREQGCGVDAIERAGCSAGFIADSPAMKSTCSILALLAALARPAPLFAAVPVSSAALLQPFVDRHELAGAVAVVVTKTKLDRSRQWGSLSSPDARP